MKLDILLFSSTFQEFTCYLVIVCRFPIFSPSSLWISYEVVHLVPSTVVFWNSWFLLERCGCWLESRIILYYSSYLLQIFTESNIISTFLFLILLVFRRRMVWKIFILCSIVSLYYLICLPLYLLKFYLTSRSIFFLNCVAFGPHYFVFVSVPYCWVIQPY